MSSQKTIWKSKEQLLRLVEDVENNAPILWIADDLDETELSFNVEELSEILPIMQQWLSKQEGA